MDKSGGAEPEVAFTSMLSCVLPPISLEPVTEPATDAVSVTDPPWYVAPVEDGAAEPLLEAVPLLGLAVESTLLAFIRSTNETTDPPPPSWVCTPVAWPVVPVA